MNLSEPAIYGLAHTWISLHGRAAEPHLHHLIDQMRRSGDVDGAARYRQILDRVCALRTHGEVGVSPQSTGIVSAIAADDQVL